MNDPKNGPWTCKPLSLMNNKEFTDLQGQIERITYQNDENNFVIARVKVYGRKDLATVTGIVVNPTPGEIIKMKGQWENHPKYGEQFKIILCQTMTPATVMGMERYLGSGLVKGIGPVMAKRIVAKFKAETLEVIENNIARLAEVEGIGAKRLDMIKRAWEEQKEIRQVMVFLQSHGVSSGYAARIFRQYGNEAIKIVQENPYRLATDVFGIGFVTADGIAQKLGFAKDSEARVKAGILFVLHGLTDEGHVYCPHELLIDKCREILEVDRETVVTALAAVRTERQVIVEDSGSPECAEGGKAVYLAGYYIAETLLASRMKRLVAAPQSIRKIDSDKAVRWIEERLSITLAEKQIEAVKSASQNKVLIITGGPGTGKTTIINAIIKIFAAIQTKILLAAPTGRAAKRMSETTGREAKTIHRILEYNRRKGGFQKNENCPLDCQLFVLDEASMVDTLLMHHLLKAMPVNCTFIMVGDVNQIPSVGAGNVLKDVIESGIAPVVQLNEIFRQAEESSIIVNAHRINEGGMPNLLPCPDKLDDFYFIEQEDPQKNLEMIISLVRDRIPKRFGFDAISDIQVLSPMHRGTIGAGNLNLELQKALNPGEDGITRGGRIFRLRDKVMQIVNNYDKEVYNGDIGRIVDLDRENQEAVVMIDDREVRYDFSELDELMHAYAISVHKSQGSEYTAVVIPLLTQHYMMLQRNLLYTAVTRGKKLVVLVGSKKALAIAVRNNKTERRYTLLRQRLVACGS